MGEPQRCARIIATAVSTRHPRPRYLVGMDARALVAMDRFTPTALKDRVTRIALGL
jgi:hypothetical protein